MMIHAKGIDWRPIDAIPGDRKDGRNMLLWADGPDVGTWEQGGDIFHQLDDPEPDGHWRALYECLPINGVTHWADINPPV
jgi:hypothetical protein